MRTLIGAGLAVAGLTMLFASLANVGERSIVQRWDSNGLHPIAALAWAQANCNTGLILVPGTPRLQADDLLQTATRFDSLELRRGRPAACKKAAALAANVSTHTNAYGASRQGLLASVR